MIIANVKANFRHKNVGPQNGFLGKMRVCIINVIETHNRNILGRIEYVEVFDKQILS